MRLRNIPGAKEEIGESAFVVQDPCAWRGHWRDRAGMNGPLHIEIGMGKGRFIMEQARLDPETLHVGIEMYDSVLLRAVQRRRALEETEGPFSGLYFIRMDARQLADVFAPGEADRLYLNFSDPWPKARHADRRLTSARFLERYTHVLRRDGELIFKTDNRELFDFSVETARSAPAWELTALTEDLHGDPVLSRGNVMTEYEEKFSSQGNPICMMKLRLLEPFSDPSIHTCDQN